MPRNRARSAFLSVAMIAAVGLTVIGTATSVSAAAQADEITSVNSSKPIAGEDITIQGTIATPFVRAVELQRKFHDTWKVVDTANTDDTGKFLFVTSTTVTRTYRVVAHTLKTDAHTFKLRTTQSETVTPVKDTVKISTSQSEVVLGHDLTVNINFTATRLHRALTLLLTHGGTTAEIPTSTETGKTMALTLPATAESTPMGAYTVQVRAEAWHGAPAVVSNTVPFDVVAVATGQQKDEITTLDPAKPLSGDFFTISGTIASRLARPVELQRLFHDTWKVERTASTDASGAFEIPASTTVKRTYRVVAHTFKTDAHTYKLRKTAAKTVTPIEQSIKLSVSPSQIPVGKPSTLTFTAKFFPIRPGSTVSLVVEFPGGNTGTTPVGTETGGTLTFTQEPTLDQTGTYRAWVVVDPGDGNPTVKSNKVTFKGVPSA